MGPQKAGLTEQQLRASLRRAACAICGTSLCCMPAVHMLR
ncbi:unnamed protein product [Tetraodon nigroviridis]|uniref:(spotted green pufferfish) hypothetical protein n=1 Tax=Tetraodon nigroviridis TaxID=99883 RepID=Q4RNY9_TETNG|nr:unnamed protein product [Tetraodon nigroviridis]